MKYLPLLLILFSISAQALPCKVERTDNVTLFGHCTKIKGKVLFYSCADFSCQVNQSLTRPLDTEAGESTCKMTSDAVLKAINTEHPDLSKVDYCLYSK